MNKKLIASGLIFILFSIILGAFAAHGLESAGVEKDQIDSFETGVRYLFISGISFLAWVGLRPFIDIEFNLSYRLVFWGTLLFSISIFLLVVLPILELNFNQYIGPVTPIGGFMMILGWFIFTVKYLRTIL